MKNKKNKWLIGLASGMLPAISSIAVGITKASANSLSMVGGREVIVPPNAPESTINWSLVLVVGLVVLVIVVAVVVSLVMMRRGTSRKRPARLGMPPTMPPPTQPATPPPYATTTPQQQPQPTTAGKLILPDNSEIPLQGGTKSIGRADFERLVPPDMAKYISRQHLVVGFAYGNYYIEDAGSGNGTKLNGREIKGAGSQWLKDGDQINLAGVITVVFRSS